MNLNIHKVKAEPGYQLLVKFNNGEARRMDMKRYLDKGIFRELKEERYFKKVRIIAGGIEWPHEQDLSADTIYYRGTPVSKPNKAVKRKRPR